jgi:cytidyltransferase-like protein
MTRPRILVDMSATLLHHGHIRLIEHAHTLGSVTIALCSDEEILLHKGYSPELSFDERREILMALRHVEAVVKSNWVIDDKFMDQHGMDMLVHGDDNFNEVSVDRVTIYPRTPGISSSGLRLRSSEILRNRN